MNVPYSVGPQVQRNAAWLKQEEAFTHFGTDLHSLAGLEKLPPINSKLITKRPLFCDNMAHLLLPREEAGT